MIGRAGRPQFDRAGLAIILTDTNSEVWSEVFNMGNIFCFIFIGIVIKFNKMAKIYLRNFLIIFLLKYKYKNLTSGMEKIESSLHENLIEHMNAEIVLQTISDLPKAIEWLKSTFFYIRVRKNPSYYG